MIAHVAAAGEASGRVVLTIGAERPNPIAVEAAIRVAQGFGAEIETLCVEDVSLINLASFPFAREVSLSGRALRPLNVDAMVREIRLAWASATREIARACQAVEVPVRQRVVRAEPVQALALACAERGPWNVLAFAEPFGAHVGQDLRALFAAISDATGAVLVGPLAVRTSGPVLVAVEDGQRLPFMLHAAVRLAPVTEGPIRVLLIADTAAELADLDAAARLLPADREDVTIEGQLITVGAPAVVAARIGQIDAGFVIAHVGGSVLPDEGSLRPLASVLACPLFVVR